MAPRQGSSADRPPIDLWLIRFVVAVAALELVILRLATRTAIHIPGISRIESPYRITAEIGRLAYYMSVVLVVATLVGLLWQRATTSRLRAGGLAITWFLIAAGSARLGYLSDTALAWSVVGCVALLLPAATRRLEQRGLPVLLFGMGFVVAGAYSATRADQLGSSLVGPAPDGLLPLAEALALAACLASPVLVRAKPERAPVVAGLTVTVATMAALVASPATVKIVLLWNFGLAGYYPSVLYAAALGALAFTMLSARTSNPHLTLGLALLAIGGLGLHSSYQSGLVILGLVTLAHRERSMSAEMGKARGDPGRQISERKTNGVERSPARTPHPAP